MYFLRNVIIFWLKLGIFSQIRFWKKFLIFLGQIFFEIFSKKFFFAINQPKKEFKANKIFSKNFKKIFWYKNFFWKKLICEKTPSLSKKMMIYHKMPMSGVYENVFQTSEISILLSFRIELLFTLCVRTPSKDWSFIFICDKNISRVTLFDIGAVHKRRHQFFEIFDPLSPLCHHFY